MAFRFSLATVMRMREIAEQREERLLGQILARINLNRQTLSELGARREELLRAREALLKLTTSAAELLVFQGQLQAVEELQLEGAQQLGKLTVLRDQQMKVYERAHRDRELLAGLRQDQFEHFTRRQNLQEQRMMDDNFSSRRPLD